MRCITLRKRRLIVKSVLPIVIVVCVISGCKSNDKENRDLSENTLEDTSEKKQIMMNKDKNIDSVPNKDPETMSADDLSSTSPIDVQNELEYDNMSVSLEKKSYSVDEIIRCTITNGNVGKGFFYYYVPFIEYYNNEEWVRLSYYPPETQYDEQWYFCAIEGNDNKENSTVIMFDPQYVSETLKEGRYRLVIFMGQNKYYAEFSMGY